MAMLPEKVVHDARADASPAFWMVVVAALQEDWAGWISVFVLLPVVRASSLTSDTSSGNGHYGRDVLERHLVINGSWITDGWSAVVRDEVFEAPRVKYRGGPSRACDG